MGAIVAMQPLVYYLPEKGKYAKRSQMKVSISELMTLEQEEISAKYILSFDDRLLVFAAEEACSLAVFENLLSKMTIHLQEKTEAPVKYLYFSSAYCPAEMKACNEQIKQKIPALIFCSHRSSLSAQEDTSGQGARADTKACRLGTGESGLVLG